MTGIAHWRPQRIAVLALDDVYAFELGIPSRIFGTAVDAAGRPLYEVVTCTVDGASVHTSAGFRAVPDSGPSALAWADTVVVPPQQYGSAIEDGTLPDDVAAAVSTAARCARMVSICTGAFVLAAAGVLDGRTATTHWGFVDRFRRLFPTVRLDPAVLFVDDGDVLTSAGAAAGIDLCLHLIRRDHGSEVANRAARVCVVAPWREGGQAQFVERPVPQLTGSNTEATRAWALEHLDDRLDLPTLARHARMSVRTFTRQFREQTGLSPARWLTQQRIDRARHLLESTELTVEQVARYAGFGTGTALRQQMHAALGVAPNVYRRTFRTHGRAD